MMRPDASLHADETGRHVGEPRLDLTARPLLAQDDRATAIVADDVERVLADVDADHGDLGACCLGHGRAPVDAAPVQRRSLAGQEHGRTIPLPETMIALLHGPGCADDARTFQGEQSRDFLPDATAGASHNSCSAVQLAHAVSSICARPCSAAIMPWPPDKVYRPNRSRRPSRESFAGSVPQVTAVRRAAA